MGGSREVWRHGRITVHGLITRAVRMLADLVMPEGGKQLAYGCTFSKGLVGQNKSEHPL